MLWTALGTTVTTKSDTVTPSSSLQSGWEKAASGRHEAHSGTHRQGNCLAEQRFPAKHLKTGKVAWVSGEV